MIQPERVLTPDIRAQLSARLSSRLTCSPSERVDNAFQAGVESKTAILAGRAVVGLRVLDCRTHSGSASDRRVACGSSPRDAQQIDW